MDVFRHSEEDHIADGGERANARHERPAALQPVRDVRVQAQEDGCDGVGRDSEQLGECIR